MNAFFSFAELATQAVMRRRNAQLQCKNIELYKIAFKLPYATDGIESWEKVSVFPFKYFFYIMRLTTSKSQKTCQDSLVLTLC